MCLVPENGTRATVVATFTMKPNDEKRHKAALLLLEEKVPVMKAVAAKFQVAANENLPLPERQAAQSDVNYHSSKIHELVLRVKKSVGVCYPELVAAWARKYPNYSGYLK